MNWYNAYSRVHVLGNDVNITQGKQLLGNSVIPTDLDSEKDTRGQEEGGLAHRLTGEHGPGVRGTAQQGHVEHTYKNIYVF